MENKIENLEKVKERFQYTGFGTEYNQELDNRIAAGQTDIRMERGKVLGNAVMLYGVEVKVDQNKAFFNGFEAIRQENGSSEKTRQWFPSYDRVTEREADNMLLNKENPRSVYKTLYNQAGDRYNTWLQIDFTKTTENNNHFVGKYNDKYFNLPAKLAEYNFNELSNEDTLKKIIATLKKGDQYEVTPQDGSNYDKVYISAHASMATLTIEDADGKYLKHDQFRTPEARQQHAEKNQNLNSSRYIQGGANDQNIPSQENIIRQSAGELVSRRTNKTEREQRNDNGPVNSRHP